MKKTFFLLLFTCLSVSASSRPLGKWVDPFIGTDYTGHTSPAAACPLGMVQPGPQSGNYLWKYCSGYNWSDSLLVGFTQNRLSGTGVPSLCNVLVNPQYIQLRSNDPKATLARGIKAWDGSSPDSRTLCGHIKASSWVQYDLWYEISFDQPFNACDTLVLHPDYKAPAYVLDFGERHKPVKARISLSYTSAEGAHANLSEVSPPASVTGEVQDITGLIGQYSQGNEPCHHVIYLYSLAGRRDKAAERIRQVFREFYRCEPGGLCGNDDCGQMSAWYIFSALGYYPVNPVGGQFVPGEAQVRPLRKLPWE